MAHTRTLIRHPRSAGTRLDTDEAAPGAWLRLAALGAAAATGLVVISGALHLGLPHRVLAILAVPLFAAVVIAAAAAHRRMLVVSIAALALFAVESAFGGVVAFTGRPEWAVVLHVVFAGLGSGGRAADGRRVVPWRARSGRRMARLRSPHKAPDHASPADYGGSRNVRGRRRSPGPARAGGRPGRRCAGMRRGERPEPLPRPRHRRPDGRSDIGQADRGGTPDPTAGDRVRARALGLLLRPASQPGERL